MLQLKQEGYGADGDLDEEIVDRWFRELCANVVVFFACRDAADCCSELASSIPPVAFLVQSSIFVLDTAPSPPTDPKPLKSVEVPVEVPAEVTETPASETAEVTETPAE